MVSLAEIQIREARLGEKLLFIGHHKDLHLYPHLQEGHPIILVHLKDNRLHILEHLQDSNNLILKDISHPQELMIEEDRLRNIHMEDLHHPGGHHMEEIHHQGGHHPQLIQLFHQDHNLQDFPPQLHLQLQNLILRGLLNISVQRDLYLLDQEVIPNPPISQLLLGNNYPEAIPTPGPPHLPVGVTHILTIWITAVSNS